MAGRTFMVASGKGGTGKTTLSITLAHIFANRLGKKTLLVDADFLLPSTPSYLRLNPKDNFIEMVSDSPKRETVAEYVTKSGYGFDVLAGGSTPKDKNDLPRDSLTAFANAVSSFTYDITIYDVGAGLTNPLFVFSRFVDRTLIVTEAHPAALIGSYKTIRALHMQSPDVGFHFVFNKQMQAMGSTSTIENYIALLRNKVTDNISDATVLPFDQKCVESAAKQTPLSANDSIVYEKASTLAVTLSNLPIRSTQTVSS